MALDPRLQGILTALITPLGDDREQVDAPALGRLIDHVLRGGSSGVVVLGGTGEYTALSSTERERAVAAAVEHTAGRAPVVVGILSPGLGDARQMARAAERLGADYIMPVAPYYVHPSQAGILDWYRALADATTLPIMLYNIPYRTTVNLLPETALRLAEETGRVAGIKECAPDMGQVTELIQLARGRFAVLSGEEYYALPELMLGAQGAVLASANLVPERWVRLYRAARADHFDEASAIYFQLFPLLRAVFSETNPGPLKEAMRQAGLPAGPVASPLADPSPATRERLRAALAGLMVAA